MRILEFRSLDKLGDVYRIPVIVSTEQGVTYAGPEDDVVDLEQAEAMCTKPAQVKGAQVIVRGAIGYKTAASALRNGPQAFANATQEIVRNLMDTTVRRVEWNMLYGQSSLCEATGFTNVSATETTLDISQASFAAGLWVGSANARIEAFDTDSVTSGAQIGASNFQVKEVDCANRTLTITGDAGDITALETALGGASAFFFYKDSRGDKQPLGLDKIITTNGTLFNIDNSIYDLFRGQVYDVQSTSLNFDKLTDAIICATHYGLEGDVIALVSPETWQDLNKDEAALREYDVSYKSPMAEKGVEGITYHYQMGKITVVSHSMVKQGEGFILKPSQLSRVGASDITMSLPGFDQRMMLPLENKTAVELRTYTDQALFTSKPAQLIKLINIVNS